MNKLAEKRKAMNETLMREAIGEAGASVLAEVGFATLTMERVAEAAGVSKGTLYNYFRDKDALVLEVVDSGFQPLLDELDRVFADRSDIPGVLIEATRVLLHGIEQRRELGQVLCGQELSPVVTARLRERFLRVMGLYKTVFTEASEQGLLSAGCPAPEAAGRIAMLGVHGVIDERMRYPEDCPSVEDELTLIERMLIHPWFKEIGQ